MSRRGRVILVGAGPGDPDLITLRGAQALRDADVVLYDELASLDLLALAPTVAQRINVGKRGHDAPTRSQDDVNALLIERARAGDTVVRLKGGDPFVFGRGGEEASACARAGVPIEIVPGISSALAAPAYAGIPLTDRRHSASFAVVTGHKDPTRVSEETRWSELGRAVDTLVILMGMRNLPELVGKIVAGGKDPATPAAAIMWGTLPRQRVVEAPLAELPARVRESGLGSPAAVVVGDVVRLRQEIQWWEKRPLFGMRVLVTRTAEQAGPMLDALRRLGAEPVLVPMIRLAPPEDPGPLDRALGQLASYDLLVLTSANAARFLGQRARALRQELSVATGVVCVGPQTAGAALEVGLPIHLVSSSGAAVGDGQALAKEIAERFELDGLRVLLPRSEIGREELRESLARAGASVDVVTAYRTLPPEAGASSVIDEIRSGALAALTFASPSAVRHLMALLDVAARRAAARCIVAAVGPTTAAALRSEGLEPDVVPTRPGGVELVAALAEYVTSVQSGGSR